MQRILFALLFFFAVNSANAQIPVTDVAANTSLLQQLVTAGQQLTQLQTQVQTLKNQYAAITGNYGRGLLGTANSINASSIVPGSWQDVVAAQQNGTFGQKLQQYEQQLNTASASTFGSNTQANTTYQNSSNAVRSSLASTDALYTEIQTHLNNVTMLTQQIETTQNTKDAQDLQSRISAEQAYILTAQAKLSAQTNSLQANYLNQVNQGTAQTARFFGSATTTGGQ